MGFQFGQKSLKELDGVHPTLVGVFKRAITLSTVDFAIHDGLRTKAEQQELVAKGASQTMDSKHIIQADGFGHAGDLVPYVNGKLRWEWGPIYEIAHAVRTAAREAGSAASGIIWGGVWDTPLVKLEGNLEDAVEAYVARRKALGKKAFIDGPHFQLA